MDLTSSQIIKTMKSFQPSLQFFLLMMDLTSPEIIKKIQASPLFNQEPKHGYFQGGQL